MIDAMRTNIEIDDELLSQAMTATGLATKRATVEEGLRLLVRLRKQTKALAELKALGWEGDLGESATAAHHAVVILVDSSVWIAKRVSAKQDGGDGGDSNPR